MKENMKLPIASRPELDLFESYKPGFSVRQIALQYGIKNVIKLASNENPLGASPKAQSAFKKVANEVYRDPETRSIDLRNAIAEKLKLDVSHIIIGAGSDEIIELLAKAFLTPQDEIIVSASSFIQYRIAARLMGAGIVQVPMKEMKHDLLSMAQKATAKTKIIFVANPNNPTGTYNTKKEVEIFLQTLPPHVLPVFDEAYFEYASTQRDYPSVIEEFFNNRPLVVLRTFSKIYGLAGLRVGYGVAPESLIQILDRIRPPFNVSVAAQAAALAALTDEKHVKKSVSLNERERDRVAREITNLGFGVTPSAANFLLFRVYPWTGRALFEALLRKSIIARAVDEYALPEYLRVTIGDANQNSKFLKALREVAQSS